MDPNEVPAEEGEAGEQSLPKISGARNGHIRQDKTGIRYESELPRYTTE